MKLKDKLTFGKHKGKTIEEVIMDYPTYIQWAIFEVEGFELSKSAMEVYESEICKYIDEHWPSPHYSDW